YTPSLHDALPISHRRVQTALDIGGVVGVAPQLQVGHAEFRPVADADARRFVVVRVFHALLVKGGGGVVHAGLVLIGLVLEGEFAVHPQRQAVIDVGAAQRISAGLGHDLL